MARKPATLDLATGKGMRQRMWEAIRRLNKQQETFSEQDIWEATQGHDQLEMSAVRDYRRGLVGADILTCVRKATHNTPALFELAIDEGAEAPRVDRNGKRVTQGLAQEAMWRTLRLKQGDTNARELAAHAATGTAPVSEETANIYLRTLAKAGYLIVTAESTHVRGRGKTQARYRLRPDRNTGPRPPMICRTKVVFDPNENAVVWPAPVTEEDCIYGT